MRLWLAGPSAGGGGSGGSEEAGRRVVWGTDRRPKTLFFKFFFHFLGGLGASWGLHLPQVLSQVVTAMVASTEAQ